ncbi:MAG TPA: hypothetical protein VFV22_01105 [Candidatus Paceibacterota bacterium]|nr:hypothetical protein [Candidatus Paceibacterota bacterium]
MFGQVTEEGITYNTLSVDNNIRALFETVLGTNWQEIAQVLERWWAIYSIIALIAALVLFIGYVYAKMRYAQISEMEQLALRDAEKAWETKYAKPKTRNARWDIIQSRVSEQSPESWRVAIIEADIMLDEVLTNAGYVGQSLGEKLKSANPMSFTTIQDAWEAHKVRNEVAHAGSDFVLTPKSARETIMRFERVFREFGVI